MYRHVVLLGDSIIDNRLYVEKNTVSMHLKNLLEDNYIFDNSLDGSLSEEILQTAKNGGFTNDVTHFVISVGGNDLLSNKLFLLDEISGMSLDTKIEMTKDDIHREYSSSVQPIMNGSHYSGYMANIESAAVLLNYRYPKAKIMFLGLYEGNAAYNPEWKPIEHRLPELISEHNKKLQYIILKLQENNINASYIDITNTLKPEDYFNDIEPNDSGGLLIAEKIAKHISDNE